MGEKYFKNKSAKDLFPALIEENNYEKPTEPKTPHYRRGKQYKPTQKFPRPPDKNWLGKENKNWLGKEKITEKSRTESQIRRALILTNNKEHLSIYKNVLAKFNYNIEIASSESSAVEFVASMLFSLVLYENSLGFLDFEQYMRNLSGNNRRNLYYVIIGPELRTLYDLEALSLSANLVVNIKDVQYLDKILKKGLLDYETLYGPFIEILKTSRE